MTNKRHGKSKTQTGQMSFGIETTMNTSDATISRKSMTTFSQENVDPQSKTYHNRFLAGLFTLVLTFLLPRA